MREPQKIICLLYFVLIIAASCIPLSYSTAPNGSLQSIGLPGLPVWQTQTLADQKRLVAQGDLSASPGSMVDNKADALVAVNSDAAWLAEVNRARSQSGAAPVGENVGLTLGATEHARYLVKNGPSDARAFLQYEGALGTRAHTEFQEKPYWSREGTDAARNADISWSQKDPTADVDSLVIAPFHRLPILAPWKKVAGYGDYGHWPRRTGVLVLRGSSPVGTYKPVLYPPEGGAVTTGAMVASEIPSPLEACRGYSYPIGLPITIQLGPFIKADLMHYSVEDMTDAKELQTCGFDAATYPVQYGQEALKDYGAMVVIPRRPLASGHQYRVNVQSQHHEFTWAFRVESSPVETQYINSRE